MALDSQHKRVRKNRVSITYDVEALGAAEKKELPFVIGVIGNFSGQRPDDDKPPIEDREFINLTKDNFDAVLKRTGPVLNFKVDNTLQTAPEGEDVAPMTCELKFNCMADFHPQNLVSQLPELKKLVDARNQLLVLLSKADRSRAFEKELKALLQSDDSIKSLAAELNIQVD